MGVEKEAVYRRIRQNRAYNQERMEVLFGIMYRNPKTALNKWQTMVEKTGFEKTFKKSRTKPAYLGKLQGTSFLGLHKSDDRMKAEHAKSEFHKIARGWYGSVLEEEEINKKQKLDALTAINDGNNKILMDTHRSIKDQLQAIRKKDKTGEDEAGQQC